MDFSTQEIMEWEQGLLERNVKRVFKTSKNYRCPRWEALQDYRHNRGTKYIYSNECKFVRVCSNRKFRRILKQKLYDEVYSSPVPHDYKTYGWITW